MAEIVIRINPMEGLVRCALCGNDDVIAPAGPAPMLLGNELQIVCQSCIVEKAPHLARLVIPWQTLAMLAKGTDVLYTAVTDLCEQLEHVRGITNEVLQMEAEDDGQER